MKDPAYCHIGHANNPPDNWRVGCVPYEYDVARCQLCNAEWTAFVRATGMGYHKDMSTGILGGFDKPEWARKPVVYIRYDDVCRYCNWLMTGRTDQGCYDMTCMPPRRLPGARYFMLTDDEWYKAAYWRQASGCYVRYPTGDKLPSLQEANYQRGDEFSEGPPFYLADVDAYVNAATPDDIIQMGGNAWEMLETVVRDGNGTLACCYRGGSFGYAETGLDKANRDTAPYNSRCYVFGVRLGRCLDGWRPTKKPFAYRLAEGFLASARWSRRLVRNMSRACASARDQNVI